MSQLPAVGVRSRSDVVCGRTVPLLAGRPHHKPKECFVVGARSRADTPHQTFHSHQVIHSTAVCLITASDYSGLWLGLASHLMLSGVIWSESSVCMEQGHCRRKWRLTDTDLCPCGETQTMSHIVESCPLTKLNGGLSRLHSVDEDAVSWLTSYGSWHAYEKKYSEGAILG